MKKQNFFAALAVLMCLFLTSCSSNPKYQKQNGVYINTESKAVVLILGNHANAMKAPDEVFQTLQNDLDDIVYGGYFSMIISDSSPTAIEVEDPSFFNEDRKNDVALTTEIDKRKEKLIKKIKEKAETLPDSTENDLLQALREAKSVLSGTDVAKKEIIVVDTGLSTYGDLNLCSIDLNEDPTKKRDVNSIIDEYLLNFEARNVLPDLSGININFYGEHGYMAPAAPPQSDNMVTTDFQYISDLWEAIVTECNASSVKFTEIPGWDEPIFEGDGVPFVSTVLFKRLTVIEDPGTPDNGQPNPPKIDLEIFNSEIGFVANETTPISLENFISQYGTVVLEIEEYLSEDSNRKIYIAGAVAKIGNDNGYQLSLQRAEVIKKLLTDGYFQDKNGNDIYINAEQIVTIGLGDQFPDKVDEYPDGIFDRVLAKENRKVFIFNEGADYYTTLKSAYESGTLNPETITDLEKVFN